MSMDHSPRSSIFARRGLAQVAAACLAVGLVLSPPLVAAAEPSELSPSESAKPQPRDPAAGPATRSTAVPKLAPVTAAAAAARLRSPDPGVTANLWEWNWVSVARECRTVLGPAGYGGVQVAPPQDSLKRTSLGNGSDTVLHPWWEVYQPVRLRADQPDGQRATVQGHGDRLPRGWGEGLRRRSDQPHHRPGQHLLRRRQLHPLQLPGGPLRPERLPLQRRRVPVQRRRHPGLQQQAAGVQVQPGRAGGPADRAELRAHQGGRLPQQADRLRRLRASGSTRPSTSARKTWTASTRS